jgi:RND family efflux transporter MFP subunit
MKRLILSISIFSLLIVSSCQKEKKYSEDAAGVKEELSDLKADRSELEGKIKALNEKLLVLEPKKEKDPINVTYSMVQKKDFMRYSTVQASVIGDDLVNASSETGGRLLSVNYREGDYVKKGALIATVDLDLIDKQIAEVKTSLDLATTVYQRQKKLWDQNIGSEIQYLQAKNNVERIEKSLETLNAQTAKRNIYAPSTGYVDRELLKQGEMASPGMPIFQILNTAKVKVVADVPEHFLGKVKKGDLVELYFPALDKTMNRRVSLIGRSIDPSNRTFKIEINIPSGGNLKPNLLAEVKMKDYEEKDVLSIPVELIKQEVTGKKYVYTIQKMNGKELAKKKYVQTSESDDTNIIVTDGLAADDLVIIDGAEKVIENDPLIAEEKIVTDDGE